MGTPGPALWALCAHGQKGFGQLGQDVASKHYLYSSSGGLSRKPGQNLYNGRYSTEAWLSSGGTLANKVEVDVSI